MPATIHELADKLIVDFITAALVGRSEPYAQGVAVGTTLPLADKPETRSRPFVQVAWDTTTNVAGWNTGKVNTYGVVRVTVHGQQPTPTKQLAVLLEGLCLEHDGTGDIRKIVSNTGILTTGDDVTSDHLASFTIRVYARLTKVS